MDIKERNNDIKKKYYEQGFSSRKLAIQYGVSQTQILRIVKDKK